jgi:transposase
LGITAESLRKWVRQADVDDRQAAGMTTREFQESRALRTKTRELEETIEILKAATHFFVWASDPRRR